MSAPVDADSGWILGIGGAIGAVMAWLLRQISVVRTDGEAETAALWKHINETDERAADHRVEAARQFATKADVDALGNRVERAFEQHERRMTATIRAELKNRGPVQAED